VKVSGDVGGVVLVGNAGRFLLPSKVVPGEYEVIASFGGAEGAPAGKVTVGKKSVTLQCDGLFALCKVSP
jgi:hypothetical protein